MRCVPGGIELVGERGSLFIYQEGDETDIGRLLLLMPYPLQLFAQELRKLHLAPVSAASVGHALLSYHGRLLSPAP